MYGFKGGPAGVMKGKYVELNADFVYPYRNQGGFDMICSGRDKIETPEQFKQCITIFRSLPARKRLWMSRSFLHHSIIVRGVHCCCRLRAAARGCNLSA
ncbi:pyrophosphate--fructose 6-phosphate 1-phosphotransferase subunit beta 2-like [Lolium rigidum]|uniref:pyrophosphate--fructose 6-phosphate 1-phosphotransferase subunit beta 2-like n=1 Tax=Lolium rigidum TaxID=89674 RepID=UPI001F5C29A0|nr:pyrophosphate--fructose 6-phosphate 1-phosphotransferase subunit beta 2-like [Lolium rigidum]